MAYNTNIPQPADLLSQSEGDIQSNFQAIATLVAVNHVQFNDADQGKHKYVEFPAQLASPPIAFAAGEVALYSFLNTITNKNELYVNKTNQATVVQIPFTASNLSASSAPTANTLTWGYLPSGLFFQSGGFQGTGLGGLNVVNTATAGVPNFNQILQVIVSPFNSSSTGDLNFAVRLVDITGATTFRVYVSSRTTTGASTGEAGFKYLAIGY